MLGAWQAALPEVLEMVDRLGGAGARLYWPGGLHVATSRMVGVPVSFVWAYAVDGCRTSVGALHADLDDRHGWRAMVLVDPSETGQVDVMLMALDQVVEVGRSQGAPIDDVRLMVPAALREVLTPACRGRGLEFVGAVVSARLGAAHVDLVALEQVLACLPDGGLAIEPFGVWRRQASPEYRDFADQQAEPMVEMGAYVLLRDGEPLITAGISRSGRRFRITPLHETVEVYTLAVAALIGVSLADLEGTVIVELDIPTQVLREVLQPDAPDFEEFDVWMGVPAQLDFDGQRMSP